MNELYITNINKDVCLLQFSFKFDEFCGQVEHLDKLYLINQYISDINLNGGQFEIPLPVELRAGKQLRGNWNLPVKIKLFGHYASIPC